MLWQYLVHVICGWNGDVIIMSDFNKVCIEAERFGSTFNARGAAAFNSFISTCGLVEVKDKKEKAHVLKNSLKKKLADIDFVLDKGEATSDMLEDRLDAMNSLTKLEKMESIELAQKAKIKWSIEGDENSKYLHGIINKKRNNLAIRDKGEATSDMLEDRLDAMNSLTKLEKMESIELAQKAKIKWSIEGDENSKYLHGIINKKRNNLAIRGIIVDGVWIEDPSIVKNEFLSHFRNRFDSPCTDRLTLNMEFPNILSYEQAQDLERVFLKDEIQQVVWDCSLDKSPGLDGFTFGFYRKFWSLLEDDVVDVVYYIF
nr:RNA-directed DNA polymerase, eukaryota [Tanacetum cinerariifolium]